MALLNQANIVDVYDVGRMTERAFSRRATSPSASISPCNRPTGTNIDRCDRAKPPR
jgi:hypothetical protein